MDATAVSGTHAAQFTDNFNDSSNVTLVPGATIALNVTFAPTSNGGKNATLEIVHSGANTPLMIPLRGNGRR